MVEPPTVESSVDSVVLEAPVGVTPLRVGCVILAAIIVTIGAVALWPRDSRAAVEVFAVSVISSDQRDITVTIGSCYGEPVLNIIETSEVVTISATAIGQDTEQRSCADVAVVSLERPLADRELVDGLTGAHIDRRFAAVEDP